MTYPLLKAASFDTFCLVAPQPYEIEKNFNYALHELDTGFPTSHQPRYYAAPNFLKMGIKMPTFVVFWTTSTIKDEKSAAKFHYIKTVSGKVVEHFEWCQYIGRRTTPSP